jgi:hypothetical protein
VKWDFYAPLGSGRRVAALVKTELATKTPISKWKCMKVWYIPKSSKKVIMIKVIVTHLPLERVFLSYFTYLFEFFDSVAFPLFSAFFVELLKIFLLTVIVKFFISIKIKYLITSFLLFIEVYRNSKHKFILNFTPICKFKKNAENLRFGVFFRRTTKQWLKKSWHNRQTASLFYLTGNGIAWACNVGSYCFLM